MHFALVQVGGEDLDVASSTVNLLLVLDGELDDQCLPLVAEGRKAGRQGVEAGVLAGLETWSWNRQWLKPVREQQELLDQHLITISELLNILQTRETATELRECSARSLVTFVSLRVSVELSRTQFPLTVIRLVL